MRNITLFFGEEDFLMDEEIKALIASAGAGVSIERVSGDKKNFDQMISSITSVSMFSSNRLLFISDLEYKDDKEDKLFSALDNLDSGTKIIFVFYGSVDKRRKFYKKMEKTADVKEFKRFSEWEMDKTLAWLIARVKKYGKKIGSHAANLLIDTVGASLRQLDKEIEKISTYLGDREMIEERDVEGLASSGSINSFEFSNAMRDKDTRKAMDILNRLFKDNEDPHMLIGMLAKLYRMLLSVKSLEQKGLSQYEISSKMNAKPFLIKKCMENTSSFKLNELANNIKLLHLADLKMKSGYSPRLTLEMLVPELICGS
jgi:DNA polymerase III subunit delta